MKSTPQTHFAKLVQEFFLDRLIRQRNSSPQTVAAYRDCFRLLFEFVQEHRNKPTDRLVLTDLCVTRARLRAGLRIRAPRLAARDNAEPQDNSDSIQAPAVQSWRGT